MKLQIITLALFISANIFCQNRTIHIQNTSDLDSSYWYNWIAKTSESIDLILVLDSPFQFYFRLSTNNQVLDIWKNSNGFIQGQITTWTKEYTPEDEQPTNRYFFEKLPIDSIKSAKIFELMNSLKIEQIPDESLISNWEQGFDGIIYTFETSTSTDYYFKTYWTPKAQDSLIEAITIQTFIDTTLLIINSQNILSEFNNRIPFECSTNGGSIRCKVLTKKEKREYKKERNNYH